MDYFSISTRKMCNVVPCESTTIKSFVSPLSFLRHHLAAAASPLPKASTCFLFIKTLTTRACDIPLSSPPSSACYPSTCPSTPDTLNTSPCTRAPLWTACSCRCLPRKLRGRKSRFYHHLDCRYLQLGELL